MLPVSPDIRLLLQNGISLLLIAAVALILFQIVQAAENFILARYGVERADRFQARRIRTQVTVLKKIVVVIIGIFTLASMLMIFESVRQFGTSILASAGIAGIIIGLAAQRSIATLLAGIQLAFTRPIRIDDVVVVENEWGRIEDITLTFVIVCIWDKRRLILPITYFMEHPFQNWTSTSSDVLGTVFLHVDYTMPIQALREELDRIVEKSQYWDGQSKSVLVTNAKEHTLEVRAMASAADGDQAWFLRCEIREKLVEFIQKNYPGSLPRLRAELEPMQEVKTERRESVKQAGRGR
ncbi:MAG: mechanosensitive ion channel [Betaproteobacteria bacterium]|nr:mechanosensitive ion channel [Betaproteobacteria bacterium]